MNFLYFNELFGEKPRYSQRFGNAELKLIIFFSVRLLNFNVYYEFLRGRIYIHICIHTYINIIYTVLYVHLFCVAFHKFI